MASPFGNLMRVIVGDNEKGSIKKFLELLFVSRPSVYQDKNRLVFLGGIYFPSLFLQSTDTVSMVESVLDISVVEGMISCGYLVVIGRYLQRQKVKRGKP